MECDQLSVDLRNKNETLKKFSAKVTKLEIQVIEAQAQNGVFDRENSDPDTRQRAVGVSPNPKKTGVSGKLKSFFGKIGKSKDNKKEVSPRLTVSKDDGSTIEEEKKV